MPQRFFSEDEAAQIMRRAAQMQETTPGSGYAPGISEEELRRISEEVGISGEFLERAMRENAIQEDKSERGWLLGKRTYNFVVDGVIEPNDLDLLVDALPSTGQQQLTTQVGRSVRSRGMVALGSFATNITSREGRTRITVDSTPVLSTVFGIEAIIFGLVFSIINYNVGNLIASTALFLALTLGGLALLIFGAKFSHRMMREKAREVAQRVAELAKPEQS